MLQAVKVDLPGEVLHVGVSCDGQTVSIVIRSIFTECPRTKGFNAPIKYYCIRAFYLGHLNSVLMRDRRVHSIESDPKYIFVVKII